MSVDVHGGADVGVSQKLLHVLRRCPVGEKVARERVAKLMEVETLKPRNHLRGRPADDTDRTGRFKASVRAETNEVDLPVILRYFLRPLQTVQLIVAAALLLYLPVVVQAVKLAVPEAVFVLLGLRRLEDARQRVAEVHRANFSSLETGIS